MIQATQAANTRSKAEKTYHFVYSFLPGEQPDLETLHAIKNKLCGAGLVIGESDLGIWAKVNNVDRDLSMKALTDRLGSFQSSEQ